MRLPDSQCRAHNATIRGQRPSRANIGIRPRVYQVGEGNRYARDQRRMAWVPCSILMPMTVWRWQYQEREETDRNGGIGNGDGDPHPSCRNRTSNPYGCGSITEPILKGPACYPVRKRHDRNPDTTAGAGDAGAGTVACRSGKLPTMPPPSMRRDGVIAVVGGIRPQHLVDAADTASVGVRASPLRAEAGSSKYDRRRLKRHMQCTKVASEAKSA